jgi:hypothetical protein
MKPPPMGLPDRLTMSSANKGKPVGICPCGGGFRRLDGGLPD